MTAEAPEQAGTEPQDLMAGYISGMDDKPLLGYLVLYSVFDGNVRPDDLAQWFKDLGLDTNLLPAPLRADGAFEVATSHTEDTYPIPSRAPAAAAGQAGTGTRRRPGGKAGSRHADDRTATLMIRRVRRDDDTIICHLVREVRDAARNKLGYTNRVAEITFTRDRQPGAAPGAGSMQVTPNLAVIPKREHEKVLDLLSTLEQQFDRNCRYLTGDKIRTMLRAYIESLAAIKVRPSGGVYFVGRQHADVLDALRCLISRFGARSGLYPVPLPDQEAMREMVIEAWRTEQRTALQRLSEEIAKAQDSAKGGTVTTAAIQRLFDKFRRLQDEAGEHGRELGADLDDMTFAMDLAGAQIMALLAQAG